MARFTQDVQRALTATVLAAFARILRIVRLTHSLCTVV
jgi:hypothetical protein